MPHADWNERCAYQKRWKRENATKVRAQKRRARIKKKCLSKNLVVVLGDYRKRMSTPVTKTLVVVLEDYRKKLPTPPPKNKNKRKKRTRREHNELLSKKSGTDPSPPKRVSTKEFGKVSSTRQSVEPTLLAEFTRCRKTKRVATKKLRRPQ